MNINLLLVNTTSTSLLFADWFNVEDYSGQLQKRDRGSVGFTGICQGAMYSTGEGLNTYNILVTCYKPNYHINENAIMAVE